MIENMIAGQHTQQKRVNRDRGRKLFGLGSYWYSAVMGVLGWICTACVCRETIEVLLSLNFSSYTPYDISHMHDKGGYINTLSKMKANGREHNNEGTCSWRKCDVIVFYHSHALLSTYAYISIGRKLHLIMRCNWAPNKYFIWHFSKNDKVSGRQFHIRV